MEKDVLGQFYEILDRERVIQGEPLKRHTTFQIGGPAKYFLCPESTEEIKQLLSVCKDAGLSAFILGRGSNLLVSDQGYDGAVIRLYRNFSKLEVEGCFIRAQAGALLSLIARRAMEAELTGMEFAGGIPGTLGGAVVMNAGAYGGEMKDVLRQVTVLTPEGEILTLDASELQMGYRTSIIKVEEYIVLEAVLQLEKGEKEVIRSKMQELLKLRNSKQPLEYPSAGSAFKRPKGYFAGKLIMDSGLRGFRVGGAQVSEKHCGFVINERDATAADVVTLMKKVSEKVKADTGVCLEPEVKFLGNFDGIK